MPEALIAIDSKKIRPGSVVFITSAKGTVVTLPNGKKWTHDGYFFAGDAGGAIKGNHIDVYTGTSNSRQRPFKFIKSSSKGKFSAVLVKDKEIISEMTSLHQRKNRW